MPYERPERLIGFSLPSARALPSGTLRGEGEIIFLPPGPNGYGVVLVDGQTHVKVPKAVVDSAHHRDSFKERAIADVSFKRLENGDFEAMRVNQIWKQRKVA